MSNYWLLHIRCFSLHQLKFVSTDDRILFSKKNTFFCAWTNFFEHSVVSKIAKCLAWFLILVILIRKHFSRLQKIVSDSYFCTWKISLIFLVSLVILFLHSWSDIFKTKHLLQLLVGCEWFWFRYILLEQNQPTWRCRKNLHELACFQANFLSLSMSKAKTYKLIFCIYYTILCILYFVLYYTHRQILKDSFKQHGKFPSALFESCKILLQWLQSYLTRFHGGPN